MMSRDWPKSQGGRISLFLLLASTAISVSAATLDPAVVAWLNAQTNLQSWSADFVQTRTLKSLVQPLTATGHVWFAAPNRFRWELGSPAETVAVRTRNELLIIYPQLKRVERLPLGPSTRGMWRDALALLEAGFPRDQAELEHQYEVISQKPSGQVFELTLRPTTASARKMIPRITVVFNTPDHTLQATELEVADGSVMRNDFQNQKINPPIDERLFSPAITPDYTVTEPLNVRKR